MTLRLSLSSLRPVAPSSYDERADLQAAVAVDSFGVPLACYSRPSHVPTASYVVRFVDGTTVTTTQRTRMAALAVARDLSILRGVAVAAVSVPSLSA